MLLNPTFVILQVLNGLTIAAIYVLLASGLTIILGLQNIVNVAHGVFYMLGAYMALTVINGLGLNFWVSLPVAFAATAVLGALLEILGIRSLIQWKRPHHHPMILTLGIALGGGEVVKMIWGAVPRMAETPKILQGVMIMGPVVYPKYWMFVIVIAAVFMIGLWLFFNRTGLGVMVRAVAMNNEMAQAMGTNAPRLNTWVFAFGTGLAGVAGVLAAPILSVDSNMGMELLLILFVVIILGGLGSLWGMVVSAVAIGLLIAFGTAIFSGMVAKLLVFAAMIAVLIIKPYGLFGTGAAVE
jgi:branched-subunit amino acid ABC-type transport system permease component